MRISIGSDHAGFELKEIIKNYLIIKGYEVKDHGTYGKDSVDYPDFAYPVSLDVVNKISDYGILVCYTGIGMSMSCNKVKGIRGALVSSVENAILTKEHNNANVLCLSSKDTSTELALQIVDAFISTEFTYGRHERRVNKIGDIENGTK